MLPVRYSGIKSLLYKSHQSDGLPDQAVFAGRKIAAVNPQHTYIKNDNNNGNKNKINMTIRCATRCLITATAKVLQKNILRSVKTAGYTLEVGIRLGAKQITPPMIRNITKK